MANGSPTPHRSHPRFHLLSLPGSTQGCGSNRVEPAAPIQQLVRLQRAWLYGVPSHFCVAQVIDRPVVVTPVAPAGVQNAPGDTVLAAGGAGGSVGGGGGGAVVGGWVGGGGAVVGGLVGGGAVVGGAVVVLVVDVVVVVVVLDGSVVVVAGSVVVTDPAARSDSSSSGSPSNAPTAISRIKTAATGTATRAHRGIAR